MTQAFKFSLKVRDLATTSLLVVVGACGLAAGARADAVTDWNLIALNTLPPIHGLGPMGMGWSWGTVIMGAYTADHNDKVDRLVLYAPTWLRTSPSPQTSPPPLGAYIAAPMATARQRLQAGAPEDRKNDLMPASWFEAGSTAALASDPVGSKQEPPVLRSPAGVFHDNRNYWDTGKPYYDPARIKVPTMVVVAEWDQVTPSQGAQALFHKLPSSPNKRLVEIGEGTHFVMLEKNRSQLFHEVQSFLDSARRD